MQKLMSEGYGPDCEKWGFPSKPLTPNNEEELQSIYTALECPICHGFPSGVVYSCQNNRHMICKDCLPNSKICPSCSTPVSEEQSSNLKTCISNFILPCLHKYVGCPQILRGENIREHLQNCLYRPIQCIMSKCTEVVGFKKMFDHLLNDHGKKVNGVQNSSRHTLELWIEGDVTATARWPPFYFTCFNNVFLYMSVSSVHGLWAWVWILANNDEAKRFKVEARISQTEASMRLQFMGPVHSIRKSVQDIISSGQVFISNSKEIRNPFLYSKGNDNKSYWRTEVVIHQVSAPLPTSIPYIFTSDVSRMSVSKPVESWVYEMSGQSRESTEVEHNVTSHAPITEIQNDSADDENKVPTEEKPLLLPEPTIINATEENSAQQVGSQSWSDSKNDEEQILDEVINVNGQEPVNESAKLPSNATSQGQLEVNDSQIYPSKAALPDGYN